jgi:hypothetical protein
MTQAPREADRARQLRRLGWCFGIISAIACALPGIGLSIWPMFERLPQRDRPYGWLLDPLMQGGAYILLSLALLFMAIAMYAFFRSHRARAAGR